MLNEEKKIKDISSTTNLHIKDTMPNVSYNKTNKLVTALYMVTDIIEVDEPLRGRLRKLGADIVSDMHVIRFSRTERSMILLGSKVAETLSFLNIAYSIGMISEMNFSILKKEFSELKKAVNESLQYYKPYNGFANLGEYFSNSQNDFDNELEKINNNIESPMSFNKGQHNGHYLQTRIGVQKGGTLMQALSDKVAVRPLESHKLSALAPGKLDVKHDHVKAKFLQNKKSFEILKKERRFDIVNALKDTKDGLTITEIKNKIGGVLLNSSEKTLQRELVDMVKDGVLKKSGSKRWSKYLII